MWSNWGFVWNFLVLKPIQFFLRCMSMVKGWDRLTIHFHTLACWLNMLAWWLDLRVESLVVQLASLGVYNRDIQISNLLHQLSNYCTQFSLEFCLRFQKYLLWVIWYDCFDSNDFDPSIERAALKIPGLYMLDIVITYTI